MLDTRLGSILNVENHGSPEITDNRTAQSIAQKFIGALVELESTREVDQIVALFAADCEVGNLVISEPFRGRCGAARFWTAYRRSFKDVCTIFENEIYEGSSAKLEWKTEGKSRSGRKIKYEGSSFLEIKNDRITRFRAIFDPADLKRQLIGQDLGVSI